jgi:hypothetical protein
VVVYGRLMENPFYRANRGVAAAFE